MIKQTTVHNLAELLLVFFDSDYDNVELRRTDHGKLSVFFKDSLYHTKAKFTMNFVTQDSPIILDYATDNPRLEGLFTEGYPGLRNTFMLSSGDEDHTKAYWARRKPEKKARQTLKGTLGRMTKEVIAIQVKDAKSLLASLSS